MLKKNSGVTLIVLIITVGVIAILSGTLIANFVSYKETERLLHMYTDIELLADQVQLYYNNNGELPIVEGREEISSAYIDNMADQIKGNDSGNYYAIDASLLDVNLYYGKADVIDESNADIYIVNEYSHEIYYLKGIEVDGAWYYTIPETVTDISDKINTGTLSLSLVVGEDTATVTVTPNSFTPVNYSFRLDSGEWSELQESNTYTFSNLESNVEYKLQVMAVDEDGIKIYANRKVIGGMLIESASSLV